MSISIQTRYRLTLNQAIQAIMFRQGSLRDDRRRRALVEDAAAATDGGGLSSKAARRSATKEPVLYTERARVECHPRTSDFIPRRNWVLALICLLGLLAIGGLLGLHYAIGQSELKGIATLRAFDVSARSSIAGWLCAILLLASSVLSVLIYSVRRFRLDDYRGRYRLWLWVATAWLVMSVEAVAGLSDAVQTLLPHWTAQLGPANGLAWWLGPWGLAMGALALRTVLEVRLRRGVLFVFVLGGGLQIAAPIIEAAGVRLPIEQTALLTAGCRLFGIWFVVISLLLYARRVILEGNGQVAATPAATAAKRMKKRTDVDPIEKPQPKTSSAAAVDERVHSSSNIAASQATTSARRIDPPHQSAASAQANVSTASAKPHIKLGSTPSSTASSSTTSAGNASSKPHFVNGASGTSASSISAGKLSRAERKRLRREQRAQARGDDE